jgi:hypothetical protein
MRLNRGDKYNSPCPANTNTPQLNLFCSIEINLTLGVKSPHNLIEWNELELVLT